MKPATSALTTYLLGTDDTVVADLYTFSLSAGETFRYAEYNTTLTVPKDVMSGSPLNYAATGTWSFLQGPRFSRSKTTQKVGIDSDSLEVSVYPNPTTDLLGSFTWQETVISGSFDGAIIELDRFYMPIGSDGITGPLDTSLGSIVWFYGKVAEPVEISRSEIKFTVKDLRNILAQQQMPRRLFQSGCSHIFGDTMCGYDRVNGLNALGTPTGFGELSVTAAAGSYQGAIFFAGGPIANIGYYTFGTVTGVTGANAGISKTIAGSAPDNSFISLYPIDFPWPVTIGDTFTLLPGCDHSSSTCNGIFQNLLRYGGFDYIPPPEIAL